MTGKSHSTSKRILFLWLLASGTVLLLMPHDVTGKLQSLVTRALALPLRLGRIASLAARAPLGRDGSSKDLVAPLRQDNRELTNHVANLESLVNDLQEDLARLSQLRSDPIWARTAFITADALHSLSEDRFVIDRGERDGVRVGQYVLASNAIIGAVCETQARQARVALLSDSESLIPVVIGSHEIVGMLTGMGQGQIKVMNITQKQSVSPGDRVYAQARPGLLEQPFIVGTVREVTVDRDKPILQDITIEPAADPMGVFKVSVIVPEQ